MSGYIPNTEQQQREMLAEIGARTMEELFKDIKKELRLNREMNLPEGMAEMDLVKHARQLSARNGNLDEYVCFLGAGAYDHFIPSVVGHILSRQEFYTAYTPYQPEISQGTLQAIFEYQTMICELTGMKVANASMYDGGSAIAEAAAMACRATGRNDVLVARTVHPESRNVLETYARFNGSRVVEIGYSDGKLDLGGFESSLSPDTAAVIVQYPNFFGIVEDLRSICELAHKNKSLVIVSADPVSLAILKSPGELGADIVAGEGQSLGNQLNYGGPYLGFLAATDELLRKMPGRIVGETIDRNGNRGFVLTIQTREQHIRREKATSNICSNEALNALAATVYLAIMGKKGLKEAANLCLQKSHYAYEQLIGTGKFTPVFKAPFFKEFVVKSKTRIEDVNNALLSDKIIGGLDLGRYYSELSNGWLVAVTEKRTKTEIDNLVRKAGEV